MRPLSLVALILLSASHTAFGSPKRTVQWRVRIAPAKPIKPGAKFMVIITGQPDPGWHLYALEEPQGGPIATEIALTDGDPADLVRVDEAKPKVLPDPNFEQPTGFFDSAADFTLHLQLGRSLSVDANTLHVLIRYQSCTDRVCLPPHTETIVVPLMIGR